MIKEHALITLSEGKGECICNPEILIGSTFGLWDSEYRVAPKGTLLDLNAAWELFYDRRTFLKNIKFDTQEHYKMETIDGITYHAGDVTYTLLDDKGSKTQAAFTIKGNQNLANSIEWQNGGLVLYYDRVRVLTNEDIQSGYDIHYVLDNQGNNIIQDGKPLIYSYTAIPLFDIFDADEMHSIFPWFADNQHTVRLRQNLDNPNNSTEGHLGDFAITDESEVFIAKERYSENSGNILISLQSLINQLQTILGITPTFTVVTELIDPEGSSIHQRVSGDNLDSLLTTENKQSLVDAINEINSKVGDLSELDTEIKDNLVNAINEVFNKFHDSNLQLGETEGTAYEGSKGKYLANTLNNTIDTLTNHINDYSNPHQVSAQQLSVTINDPNNAQNDSFEEQFSINYNILTALQELFNRLNIAEDKATELMQIIATPQELYNLDLLNQQIGDKAPTIVGTLLQINNKVNEIQSISDATITQIVNTYFDD